MPAYYNEHDPYCGQWLKNLIAANLIAPGDVDGRNIQDVKADDIRGYTQCHFFAGIGGWSYALRLAGWPDGRHCWTGSCPCQPLSSAGQRKGHADERHLWPAFYGLIAECRPAIVFGEQVESADGREWLAGIRADLEVPRYAVGAADLCAASKGAPHIRQRLYWMAYAYGADKDERTPGRQQSVHEPNDGDSTRLGNAEGQPQPGASQSRNGACGLRPSRQYDGTAGRSGLSDYWGRFEIVECRDGLRRVEPGALPLVDGIPHRLDQLRGYGNAIVPQVAAEFIIAASEAMIELDHSRSGESPPSKLGY